MKRLLMLVSLVLASCSQISSVNPLSSQNDTEYNKDCMDMFQFRVFQVFNDNYALAFEHNEGEKLWSYNPVVLLTPIRGVDFYDDMIFTIPTDKCAVQDGTYQYKSKGNGIKTVPRIIYEYKYSPHTDEEQAKRFYEVMEDFRYNCKLSLTENNKYNTQANIKKCDCSADYIREFFTSFKEGDTTKEYDDIKKKMEKKCGRVPNGFWD